jgi:hypothetical protein
LLYSSVRNFFYDNVPVTLVKKQHNPNRKDALGFAEISIQHYIPDNIIYHYGGDGQEIGTVGVAVHPSNAFRPSMTLGSNLEQRARPLLNE